MSKRTIKPIPVIEGDDFQVFYLRNEGHTLYLCGEYIGTFDRLTDATAERDRLVSERLRRQAPPAAFEKAIAYNPDSHMFDMRLDGQLVGYAVSYGDADEALNTLIAEITSQQKAA